MTTARSGTAAQAGTHGQERLQARNIYLDILRATAILAVLVHHVAQMSPVRRPDLIPYTTTGSHGVDLFFVLSGWLIGGIFWKEYRRFGSVNIPRFWFRRWLRTIPPYMVALALAYGAVAVVRREPFDAGYLLFLQNYYERIPYFLVSWSLCVEEHFYLFIPLIALAVARNGMLLALLCVAPAALRFFEAPSDLESFGYALTATHLVADGLMVGVFLAYLYRVKDVQFRRLEGLLFGCFLAAGAGLLADLGQRPEYVLDPLLWAILCGSALALLLEREPAVPGWIARPLQALAIISYSVYLTHPLVLHVMNMFVWGRLVRTEIVFLVLESGVILLVGGLFYFCFEKTSLMLRDRIAPPRGVRRSAEMTPAADRVRHAVPDLAADQR